MTTTEKNAAIARWMGNVIDTSSGMYINQYHNFPTDHSVFPVELEYHSDWNWIMGATIMCFKRYDEVTDSSVFSADNQQFKLNDALLETNIKSLHEAV